MNYINQINAFWDWVRSHPECKPQQRILYMAILNANNRCGWKPVFSIPYSELMALGGLTSKTTYYEAVKYLTAAGLIKYKQGGNRFESATFHVVELDAVQAGSLPPQVTVAYPSRERYVTPTGNLPKLKKTKKKAVEVLNRESTVTSTGNNPKHIYIINNIYSTYELVLTGTGDVEKTKRIADDYLSNFQVQEAFKAWEQMRKNKGKRHVLTDRARELILMDLHNICKNDLTLAQKVIEESTKRNWDGLFPLKQMNNMVSSKQEVKLNKFEAAKQNIQNI